MSEYVTITAKQATRLKTALLNVVEALGGIEEVAAEPKPRKARKPRVPKAGAAGAAPAAGTFQFPK